MAPTPKNLSLIEESADDNVSGHRIVISGMSGAYPESNSVKNLSEVLYNKINPVNKENCRWKYDHPAVSPYTGKVSGLSSFDAQFFKVHYRLAYNMEPMARKMLEKAFEAIYDAGICPDELSGRKIGVFIGNSSSETEKLMSDEKLTKSGLGLVGCCRAMFGNRISYCLNLKGPSMTVDELCCSSTKALELAYLAMKRGDIEAAIVGGSSLCLQPQYLYHYGRILKMSVDGKTKSFDSEAAGCAKSEALNILFLQKAESALRIYAELVHVKCDFISTPRPRDKTEIRYSFYRDPETMANFLRKFYEEAKLSPQDVEYVEAFGSADSKADKAELEAIEKVYCKNKKDPLLVGSVMSNIGYSDGASGISATTKVLLAYHCGKLAANMHCDSPRKDVDALRDGRMRIVTDHTTFGRSYAAVNSISISGVNAHVLLKGHYKPKDSSRYKANIPQLVPISGRQESAVDKIIQDLKCRPIDLEELTLLRNIHKSRINGHFGRGFVILDTNERNETVRLHEKLNYLDDAKQPLWFVYSGMGSQWAGMGAQLMRIPVFAAAIERCRCALKPKGVDIIHIITSPDKTIFDNILNSFVGIAAIQIGLTDVLRELQIFPDMIIGHSVGELGCAYADGCFSAEEMILSAYSRGLVSLQTPFIRGSMAAVGIGYQKISKMCPPEVEVACHNGPESSTISGPADIMKEFVSELTAKGIFAKEVPCSNIAYHSRYIAEAGPGLLKYLGEVIKSPKARSERWVSTSVPQEKWNEPIAKYSSAEYHTNNLLNSVLFEETLRLIPANAVLVEIAPHGLLQAILKRSLPESCKHVPLTRRGHPDNAQFLLEAIGNLYAEGYYPQVQVLYPKVEFPVSTGTPMLSHLVEWAHTEEWGVQLYSNADRKEAAECNYVISIHDDENRYLKGHVIRGENTYPFAATLVAVWDTLAMMMKVPKKKLSVQFREVLLHSQPMLGDQTLLRLCVSIHRGNGSFEVLNGNVMVATGFITSGMDKELCLLKEEVKHEDEMELNSQDVYRLMYSRDYHYLDEFCSIHHTNTSLTKARLLWQDNWVTLIDGMIQFNSLRRAHESVSQPKFIRKLEIDVENHLSHKTSIENANILLLTRCDVTDSTRCGGVKIKDIKFSDVPPKNKERKVLKTLKFVPHFSTNRIDETSAIYVFLQVIADNLDKQEINIVNIVKYKNQTNFKTIQEIIQDILVPDIKINLLQICQDDVAKYSDKLFNHVDVVMTANLAADDNMCQALHQVLNRDTFLINTEEYVDASTSRPDRLYRSMCAHTIGSSRLELNIWRPTDVTVGTSAVTVFTENDLTQLHTLLSTLPPKHKLIILTSNPPTAALIDIVKQWKNKDNRKINLFISNQGTIDDECLNHISFTELTTNILDNGIWGGDYYLPIQKKGNMGNHKINQEKLNMALEPAKLDGVDSFHWTEATETRRSGIPVKVHYIGLNDAYVEKVLKLAVSENNSHNKRIEYDFSGFTDRNVRVMGIVQEESINTCFKAKPELLWPVPEHWTLEDAATVPLAYCLAFYCLCFKGRLFRGNSILMHGGTGALGQAVISIALAYGCEIYTTVSNIRKKQFLLKLFPQLKEDHIGNSRDATFKDMVLRGTKGKGCEIVICSVTGELRTASIYCCAAFGFVVDTSLDNENFNYGMYGLNKCSSYYTQRFSSIFDPENENDLKKLQLMVSEGIAHGYVRPLSRVVYPAGEVSRALRLQTGSRHSGRVLLDVKETLTSTQTIFRINCSADRLQILLIDNEVFGMRLADRLISRGAKKFALHFNKKSNIIIFKLRSWEKQGVQCTVSYGNIWHENITNVLNDTIIKEAEGIYIVLSSNTQSKYILKQLEQLTSMIQSQCSLKYFAVIDVRKTNEILKLTSPHEIFMSIKLPLLNEIRKEVNSEFISINNAVDAVEKALCYKQQVIIVHDSNRPDDDLLQEIADITGIIIPNGISQEATLMDLGMSSTKSRTVQTYLYDNFNVLIDEKRIPLLTIKKLRSVADGSLKIVSNGATDLGVFFSYFEHDPMLATVDKVLLPTLTTNAYLRGDEYDISETFMCIVPGVDGLYIRFRELCERLKLPVLVLQPSLDKPRETIREIAQRYVKILQKETQMKERFCLLGYESGVLAALEMAAILENHGLTGTVYCIGGSPNEVQATFEEQLSRFVTEDSLQVAVACHMLSLFSDDINLKEMDMSDCSTWKEKVDLCTQKLLGRSNHSIQYTQEFIEAAYERIIQVRRYKPELPPLSSLLVSIRPRSSAPGQDKSFSLQMYSQQRVVEYELATSLPRVTQDVGCAAIVNRHLDELVLEGFEKRNLCSTYLLNPDAYSFLSTR